VKQFACGSMYSIAQALTLDWIWLLLHLLKVNQAFKRSTFSFTPLIGPS